MRGTPLIRGSSYAPTEDFRASGISLLNRSQGEVNSLHPELASRQASTLAVPQIRFSRALTGSSPAFSTPRAIQPMRSTYFSTHQPIEPAMFDALTFKPDCDDRTLVRYSSITSAVTAATPPRLVAEITSPSFLDYELISDFFLTFRAFMEPVDLMRMLIARLRWALARNDETGMVVRVRTFVALRHWILNYFMDDFVVDHHLRLTFCNLLNDFVDEITQCARSRKVQLKILAELKKCWRRVCAHYWDGPEFDDTLDADVPIAPGGIAGHRDGSLDPAVWEREDLEPPQLESLIPLMRSPTEQTTFGVDVSRAGHVGNSTVNENRPNTPDAQVTVGDDERERGTTSPISMASLDIVSCSFPAKAMRNMTHQQTHPLAAHPVSASAMHSQSGPVATMPRAVAEKCARPYPPHKRNNSASDSLRDHSSDKASYKDQENLMTAPYAGSLVRGNYLPPAQAFVEVGSPGPSSDLHRQTTIFDSDKQSLLKQRVPASAMSGHGMKRLIGSVRRALSTRGQGVSPTQGNFINVRPVGPRGVTTNRLPGTAIVPQARRRQKGTRPLVRIDLLGAGVAEDFKKAVREEAAAEAEQRGVPLTVTQSESPVTGFPEYAAARMDSATLQDITGNDESRPLSDTGITVGSKSIVIVDDTVPFDMPTMHRSQPSEQPSIDAFTDNMMPYGADLTPPNTPPANRGDTPRRSSYLLNQHVMRPTVSHDPLPPFIPDLETLQPSQSRSSEDRKRPSISTVHRSLRHPPVSFRGHGRNRSTRTHQSLNSILHRRDLSFASGTFPQSTVRSFDATTTYSESSVRDDESDVPMPQPLRVLRRRPGGDLRAATNVGELDTVMLRRSRSVGSLTTYSESMRSSFIYSPHVNSFGRGEMVSFEFSDPQQYSSPPHQTQQRSEVFSLGQLAEKPPKRHLSLFSTHSSKPIMRPSFEVEAQKLAQIPDDEDDGGIESALLKLEGKFEKKAFKLSMLPQAARAEPTSTESIGHDVGDIENEELEKKEHRHLHVMDEVLLPPDDSSEQLTPTMQSGFLAAPQRPVTEARSFLSEASRESYCSTPLLERGLTDDGQDRAATPGWTNISVLQGSDEDTAGEEDTGSRGVTRANSQDPSYEFVEKTDSLSKIKPGDTAPSETEDQSFLDDDSDLSSELSVDVLDVEEDHHLSPKSKLPAHPLAEPSPAPDRDPPSPPMTLVQALEMSPDGTNVPQLHEHQVWVRKPMPPTPETTPTAAYVHSPGFPDGAEVTAEALHSAARPSTEPHRKPSVHLPFILAFDSEVLAQQFTLIEKDALNEIDWKDLIDMNWKNATSSDARSWVDFLRNTEAHGVEVVIARFNIMVKWAVSEIVLTQHIEERVRCLIKFIHIAAHCRRYRNFATLAQLTIALSSNEVARLSQTWSLVPQRDMTTLRELENLVTPMRNFYNIRAEMEVGSDLGCIPFVGIYTHDLLYNAQRPSEIAASPSTPPLVNFERCRIAAAVVKTLLRLLEASTRYNFQPIEGITERCLWMSALSDDEIRQQSETLE